MAPRKRTTRREKHAGHYYFDPKTKRHEWTLEYKGRRYRVKDKDEETARSRFAELKNKVMSGADVKGAKTPLKVYLPHWIDTEVTGKQSTRDDYHKRADLYILPTFGNRTIGSIKRRHVVFWVDWCMNEPKEDGTYWARASVKQALGLLRRALDAAIPEYLEYNPAAGVKVPLQRKGDEYKIDAVTTTGKVFTPEQMHLFLEEVKRTDHYHGFYAYYVLASELGFRRGEGLGIRRKDIDFEQKIVTIAQQITRNPMTNKTAITTPKTDAGKREVPVSDEVLQLLREQCLRAGAMRPDALIFPGRDGKQRQPNGVSQHFRRVCARLGFEGYTLHSVRKYAVTDWRTAGVDLEVAAALAGHKGIKTTAEVYSQPTMERKREAMKKTKKI
jgi:integrase